MKKKKGFTLIELMVVILIVGILAGVAVPILRGRVDSAKWSEGKAGAGAIATSLRAYAAEKGVNGDYASLTVEILGFTESDLNGTYFTRSNYSVGNVTFTEGANPELTFDITVTNDGTGIATPVSISLDEEGAWTETLPGAGA